MKRGVGYCENTECEDYAKGVFLLNHGDTFYCPRCRQLGKVEKERGIIEQEIKGYDDNPDWVGYRGLLGNLFREHPVRLDTAGTVETIARIDTATLQSCYDRFYHPSNMHLFVVGELDREELSDFIEGRSRAADALGGVMHSLPVSEISAAVCGFCAVKPAAAGPGPVGRFRP